MRTINRRKKVALIAAIFGSFLTPFMMSALNIALPAIQIEFDVNAIFLSWINTAYLLASAAFLVPIGKTADLFGHIRIFRLGIIIFTLVSLASAFSPSIEFFILMRVLQGIGGAMIFTTGIPILTKTFPPEERGKVLGLNVSSVYIGLSLGPSIGGVLTQALGWKSIFLVILPLGLFIIFLTFSFLKPEETSTQEDRLDILGSIIYALTLVALVYGSTRLPETIGIILIACSVPGFIIFVKRQISIPNPVFEIKLFRKNKVFAFSNVAALINYAASSAITFLLSLYLQYIKGLTPQQAGMILIIQPVVMAALSFQAGRLSDRIEPAFISSTGMACTALGLFALSFLTPATPNYFIYGALVILGLGFALFSAPNTNAIMGSVEKHNYGIASASVSTMRLLGQMFSMAIATLIISLFIGKNQIQPSVFPLFLKSIHWSFLIFSILCAIGVYFSLARGKVYN